MPPRRLTPEELLVLTASAGGGTPPPPPFAVADDFAAPDGTAVPGRTPSPYSAGFPWATLTGTPANQAVQGGQAAFSCNNSREDVAVDSGLADCTVTMDLTMDAAAGEIAIATFRVQDTNNYWQLIFTAGQTDLYSIVAGAPAFHSSHLAAHAPGVAYPVTIVLAGDAISARVGAETPLTTSNSFNATKTKHGGGGYCPGVGTVKMGNFRVSA